jgi:hypothetical protein
VFEPDCSACLVVHLAEAAARGLPQLATGPAGGDLPAAGLAAGPAGAVLAAYGRQVEELVAQVGDWQRCCQRYAADLTGSLRELREVLAELAGAGTDEDGGS